MHSAIAMTNKERRHLARIADYGCIICQRPCEIHHIRHGMGMAQKNNHYNAIGLCPEHHRIGNYGVAIHAGIKEFEKNFGTELELLERTRKILGI